MQIGGLSVARFTVVSCPKREEMLGFLRNSQTGEELDNVKSREWIALKPTDPDVTVEQLYETARKLSTYVVAAEFQDGMFAIAKKPYSKDKKCIPEGTVAVAAFEGKLSVEKVVIAIQHFMKNSRRFVSNMEMEAKIVKVEIDKLEDVLDKLKDVHPHDLDTWTAAAKRARASKHVEEPEMKGLYEGIMTQIEEVKSHFKEVEMAQLVVNRIKDKRTWDINGDLWSDCDKAKDTKGWSWSPTDKIFPEMTLDEFMNSPAHLNMSALLVGVGGAGKTQIMHSMGKTCCIRYNMQLYCYAKALDPYGALTRAGVTGQSAFFGFSDFDLNTLLNEGLSTEEVKSLFDCQEGGSHRARYHVATYPRKTTKAFAFNVEPDKMAEMFFNMNLPAFANLCNKDRTKMMQMSLTDQAIARRVAIFPVYDTLVSDQQITTLKENDQKTVDVGLDREKEWLRKNRGK